MNRRPSIDTGLWRQWGFCICREMCCNCFPSIYILSTYLRQYWKSMAGNKAFSRLSFILYSKFLTSWRIRAFVGVGNNWIIWRKTWWWRQEDGWRVEVLRKEGSYAFRTSSVFALLTQGTFFHSKRIVSSLFSYFLSNLINNYPYNQ